MSKDFPNRADWLARRATPAKLPGRYVHVSKPLVTIIGANGSPQTVLGNGRTLSLGNNKRKRAEYRGKQARACLRAQREQAKYEAHLDACTDFDAEKIAQESEAA